MISFFSWRLVLAAGLALTAGSCMAQTHAGRHASPPPPAPPPDPAIVAADPGVKRLAAGTNDFGFRLLSQLTAKQPDSNVFFSPFSISQALLLTLNGANGRTRKDMAHALGVTGISQDQINGANALLLPSLARPDPQVKVSVANALWAGKSSAFAPAFQESTRRFYGAEAAALDFSDPAAADTINAWVSRNTAGKITQIVSQTDVFGALAVLTDAIYFHGKWQKPFSKADTAPKPFHLPGGGAKTVEMMTQTSEFTYADTPQFQAVRLPYGSGRICMTVFLPKPGMSVDTLAQEASGPAVRRWLAGMQSTPLEIHLPRFHMDQKAKLKEPLSALGMASAFANGADFAPMGIRDAKIGEVLHRATLDVDEQGTTATAATAVIMKPRSAAPKVSPPPIPIMRVDRPFLVLIRDTKTDSLLFAGIVRDP